MNDEMSALAKEFKTDLGTQYEHKSRKDSVEIALDFSKRMVQKSAQERKRKMHCKLLHCALKTIRLEKNNDNEHKTLKNR